MLCYSFQVRRVGLGVTGGPRPTFDLTDPYCNNVSYDYVPMHDPHLANHFAQKPARNRMKQLGFCTKDGRAVCSLKEFNQYRKYLYNQFMDRIHMEMRKLVCYAIFIENWLLPLISSSCNFLFLPTLPHSMGSPARTVFFA